MLNYKSQAYKHTAKTKAESHWIRYAKTCLIKKLQNGLEMLLSEEPVAKDARADAKAGLGN
jgi:hypothetical protein